MTPLSLKKSKKGLGVFTNLPLPSKSEILQFHGKQIPTEELPTPYDSVLDHYLQIGQSLYLGPSGEIDDFINHSCNPNAAVVFQNEKIFLQSIKAIAVNEEVTFDYSLTMVADDWTMRCVCEEPNCRHEIVEFALLPPETQKRYLLLGIVPDYVLQFLYKSRK